MADKKIYRSVSDKWLGGVCGGMGIYFQVDPTVIRIVWIIVAVASLPTGAIVAGLAYLVSICVIPRNPDEVSLMDTQEVSVDKPQHDIQSNSLVWGFVLVILALVVLSYSDVNPLRHWNFSLSLVPIVLVAAGVYLMFKYRPDMVNKIRDISDQTRLYRLDDDKKVFGVCGGLADSFRIDPTLVRLGWALVTMLGGFIPGIVVYLIMAFILPAGRPDKPQEV